MPENPNDPLPEEVQPDDGCQAERPPEEGSYTPFPTAPEDGDPGPPTGGG